MAKDFSFSFNIGAQLAGGFQAAFSAASSAMSKTGNDVRKLNAEQKKLGQEASDMQKKQQMLNQALKAGSMSQQQYDAATTKLTADMRANAAAQEKVAASISRITSAEKAQNGLGKMFSTGPIKGFQNAISGTTGMVSGLVGKLSGMAALAATGFGLTSLVGGAVDAGEAVYQLSTKLHMSAAEAGQLSRILSLTGGDVDSAAKAIARMDKSAIAAGKSGDAMRETLAGWGVVVTDADGKLLPINEQLKNLAAGYKVAAAEGMEQEFVMATLGTKGMELTKTLQNYDEAAEQAAQVKGIGLDPAQMHQLKMNMNMLKMEGSQLQLALTSAFAPLVAEVLPQIIPLMQDLATWIAQNKTQISAFAGEAIKFAAMYQGVSMLAGGLHTLATGFNALKSAFTGIKTAFTFFKTGAALLGGPWMIAIMAIIAGIYLIYTNWDQITEFMSSVWESVCSTVSSLWDGLCSALSAGWEMLKAGFMAYINLWLMWPRLVIFAVGFIAGVISQLPSIIGSAITAAGTFLMNLPSMAINAGTEFVSAAISFVSSAASFVISGISNMVTSAGTFLQELPANCAAAGSEFVAAASAWAGEAYNAVMDWINQLPGAISNAISGAWEGIKATFSSGFSVGVHAAQNARGGIYGRGAFLTTFAEEGPEAAIPLDGSPRAISLWKQAGAMLMGSNGAEGQLTMPNASTTTGGASAPSMGTIVLQQSFYGNADPQQVQQAAQSGAEEAQQTFAQRWREMMHQKERVSFGT